MPQRQPRTGPVVTELGQLDIEGHRAVVTWPFFGDGVAIDFPELRSRFGVVVALDRDPRLRVEPCHADLVDLEGRIRVLEQVASMWIRHDRETAPAALRPEAGR